MGAKREARRLIRDVKYLLFRSIINGDRSLDEVCTRAGMSRRRVERVVLSDHDVTLRDVSDVNYGAGGEPLEFVLRDLSGSRVDDLRIGR